MVSKVHVLFEQHSVLKNAKVTKQYMRPTQFRLFSSSADSMCKKIADRMGGWASGQTPVIRNILEYPGGH